MLRRICIVELRQLTHAIFQWHTIFCPHYFSYKRPSLFRTKQRACKRDKHPLYAHPQRNRPQSHHRNHTHNDSPSHFECVADLQLSHLPDLLIQMPRPLFLLRLAFSLSTFSWTYSIVWFEMCRHSSPAPSRVVGVLIRFWIEPARRVEICEE
jgi:hypothetical protein